MNTAPSRFLHADGAGSFRVPTPASPKMKSSPAELPLTLTADVLRLPYPLATRVVLAEIVSLHACNTGLCDASDAHFAARLTINKDTVSVAVKLLEKDGLIVKVTTRTANGLYRTLAPVLDAISEKAATNPYPEKPGTRNLPDGYPEIPVKGTRKNRVGVPGNSGSNTSSRILPLESSIKSSSATHEAAVEQEVLLPPEPELSKAEKLPAEDPEAQASHTGGAARPARKTTAAKARSRKPEILFTESEYADYDTFAAAFVGTDYELANLRFYHQKVINWRKDGEPPRRRDWIATARTFMLNDIERNALVLDPNTRQHVGSSSSTDSGTRPAGSGYRSKYDQ